MSRYAISSSVSGMGRQKRLLYRLKQVQAQQNKLQSKLRRNRNWANRFHPAFGSLYARIWQLGERERHAEEKLLQHMSLADYFAWQDKGKP